MNRHPSGLSSHPVLRDARVWLDDDKEHVWFAHNCLNDKRITTILPQPKWRVVGTKVEPSIHCTACGCHGFFDLRIDAPVAGGTDTPKGTCLCGHSESAHALGQWECLPGSKSDRCSDGCLEFRPAAPKDAEQKDNQ